MPEPTSIVHSVLFVCSANQCRSPLAESIFKTLISEKQNQKENWSIESAGCWATNGFPATRTAVLAAKELSMDISKHLSQGITESLLNRFNLILCMEFDHKATLQRNFPLQKGKIFLLSEMIGEEKEVDDPVGLTLQAYLETAEEMREYLVAGLDKIHQLSTNICN